MSVAGEIADMKALLRVGTDEGLARVLHIGKGNISMWRARGRVSERARHRARMIAEHGDLPQTDSMEKIAADVAILGHRLQGGNIAPQKIAVILDTLADRVRAMEPAS